MTLADGDDNDHKRRRCYSRFSEYRFSVCVP